jgi:glycosyltransferase involved in cell wall biosynthesis
VSLPPRISIIIPTLQEERTLGRTLGQFTAALRERFRLGVIVSDGGSTDATLAIACPSARVVRADSPAGRQNISIGRNRGAHEAAGELFFFLNADVVIEDPERFFSLMTEAVSRAGIAAATCNVNIYPEEASRTDWAFHNFFNGYFWLLNLLGMAMGRGECHVMRRELFDAAGGYDESIAAGEDYEFFLRLRKHGRIAFVRSLTVFESPRRFRRYGYFRISILWFLNALSVLLFRRSLSDEWKPVR